MKMTFILKDKTEREVEFITGDTVLQAAEKNDIPLHGGCEGFGICGSCHVIVEGHIEKLMEISDLENNGLDRAIGVTMRSRLACQIILDASHDGLKIKLM